MGKIKKMPSDIFNFHIFWSPHTHIGIIYCGISPGRDDSICRALEDLCCHPSEIGLKIFDVDITQKYLQDYKKNIFIVW